MSLEMILIGKKGTDKSAFRSDEKGKPFLIINGGEEVIGGGGGKFWRSALLFETKMEKETGGASEIKEGGGGGSSTPSIKQKKGEDGGRGKVNAWPWGEDLYGEKGVGVRRKKVSVSWFYNSQKRGCRRKKKKGVEKSV